MRNGSPASARSATIARSGEVPITAHGRAVCVGVLTPTVAAAAARLRKDCSVTTLATPGRAPNGRVHDVREGETREEAVAPQDVDHSGSGRCGGPDDGAVASGRGSVGG